MTKFIKIFMVALLIVSCSKKEEENKAELHSLVIRTETGDVKYAIENAETIEELQRGLMGRETLAENSGMIFNLVDVGPVAMWMKDTKVPLDMLFVDKTGRISWLYENAVPFSEEIITPPMMEIEFVVELNAGDVRKNNIKVGDVVGHKFFNNIDENGNLTIVVEPQIMQDNISTDFEEVDLIEETE